ncbi:MAG: MarR family winged helix-turn-helix transcriptional regulator [Dermatophilaceae bacterium]
METSTQRELAAQPIGYWTGEAYRRIAAALRESLAVNDLTQPQWWVLGRVVDTSRAWTGEGLIEELTPYSAAEEGRDVGKELDRLMERGWVRADGEAIVATDEGAERLQRAQERNGETHRAMKAGVGEDEYAVAIDVLRRMVGNLGGDPRLP